MRAFASLVSPAVSSTHFALAAGLDAAQAASLLTGGHSTYTCGRRPLDGL